MHKKTMVLSGGSMFLMGLAVLTWAGCSEPLPSDSEYECPCIDGFVCVDGKCRKECVEDSDCPGEDTQFCKSAGYCAGASNCTEVCQGIECGDRVGCDCGTCSVGLQCVSQKCVTPTPTCAETCLNVECGSSDGCQCGNCGSGFECVAHQCEEKVESCGDLCVGIDCGNIESNPRDYCNCGACPQGSECQDNECILDVSCQDVCDGKECGVIEDCDCGTCEQGATCNETLHVCECVPNCVDSQYNAYECGDDGCGGSCGTCSGVNADCEDHVCVCPAAACDGKHCGPDGCGGSCGDCPGETPNCTATGKCVPDCDLESWTFSDATQKLVFMEIGKGGHPGEALDIDNDPGTCAPGGDCEGGLDNQMSGLLGQLEQFVDVDAELDIALNEGSIILVANFLDIMTDGSPFVQHIYMAQPDDPECEVQSQNCDYLVSRESFDVEDCKPTITFDNTTIVDGVMTAGGPDYSFAMAMPFATEGMPALLLPFEMVTAVGTVQGSGPDMVIVDGILGMVLDKEELLAAVDNLPPDVVEGLPVSPDMIKNLLDMFVIPDIDVDDDGVPESASFALKMSSIAGTIIGIAEPQ